MRPRAGLPKTCCLSRRYDHSHPGAKPLFTAIPEFARSAAAFVVVLGVLVFFHELGHYLAARWRGVYVEAFSVGFGRSIASWYDRHGTQWRISWLPLGGYVKMHGQERPEEVSAEVRASWKPGQTF